MKISTLLAISILAASPVAVAYLFTREISQHDLKMVEMSKNEKETARLGMKRECLRKNSARVCGGME